MLVENVLKGFSKGFLGSLSVRVLMMMSLNGDEECYETQVLGDLRAFGDLPD